ncbi:DUF2794 domain-containing protein [Hyphomicrobium sulfonivorans]|uniref:DUF2794 domain-containing protein n=1 Tax=Hyphomicrobium sulfonivorans TaxID=121290 RepID=A0A120CXJ7_HYPSL|nr:DUF2794 domain-containing protein [Hyphomicrobium sulfonivorans]KWT71097.1 hypothetical protein APY04_0759 [Hyphomicrobium sulfonivorans]MBI1648474.1 DUF2794 domain-containing protein [Hyphomicrobium sulfonivorans]NSL70988.1 DUF2794 domain-containing protein [Hyphomicrobium sulfonivorans]
MSDSEPIVFSPPRAGSARGPQGASQSTDAQRHTVFTRQELTAILDVYGRKVASGEWRDYAIDLGRDMAVFSVFRRSSEVPIYRIEKNPKLARKQGAYSVIAATGLILKRGHELKRVLAVLESKPRLVIA